MKPTKKMLKERKLTKLQQKIFDLGFEAGKVVGKREGERETQNKIKQAIGIFEF